MNINTVLFDLDGTLLPMDQDIFIKNYLSRLAHKMASFGYDPKRLVSAVWAGSDAMVKNDGSALNEKVFWDTFAGIMGEETKKDIPEFDKFYSNEFDLVREVCSPDPRSREVVELCREKGLRTILATNPLFPEIATRRRATWAGLEFDSFELVTTYANSTYCKPSLGYYREILDKLGVSPEECLMVGNDVSDDMVAEGLGMKVFLLTDCLINKENVDITRYPNGGFDELLALISEL